MDFFYVIVAIASIIAIIVGISESFETGECSTFFCGFIVLICTLIDWI